MDVNFFKISFLFKEESFFTNLLQRDSLGFTVAFIYFTDLISQICFTD